jgi:hypothetical protein
MTAYVRITCTLVLLTTASPLWAQQVDWSRVFGTPEQDWGHSLVVDKHGNIAVAGGRGIGSAGGRLHVIKVDRDGKLLWEKDLGPKVSKPGRDPAKFYKFSMTSSGDGGYFVGGGKNPRSKLWGGRMLHKLDSEGNLVWEQEFIEKNAFVTYLGMASKPDGTAIQVGAYNKDPRGEFGSQAWVLITDKEGKRVFGTDWGADLNDDACSVVFLPQGGFAAGGMTVSWGAGGPDFFVTRADKKNDLLWHKEFGGKEPDELQVIEAMPNGQILVAGSTLSFGNGAKDMYVVKVSEEGDALWEQTFGTPRDDIAYALAATPDGGILVAGTSVLGAENKSDIVVMELDDAGNRVWSASLGGAQDDGAYGLAATEHGIFYLTGFTASEGKGKRDLYLVKFRRPGF